MAKQIQLDLVFFFWGPSQYTLKNRKKDPRTWSPARPNFKTNVFLTELLFLTATSYSKTVSNVLMFYDRAAAPLTKQG